MIIVFVLWLLIRWFQLRTQAKRTKNCPYSYNGEWRRSWWWWYGSIHKKNSSNSSAKNQVGEEESIQKESLSCFMTLFDEVVRLISQLDNSIDKFDMSKYDELWHAFDDFHKDMASLCLKSDALKSEAPSLSKEIEILKSKDDQYRLYEEILRVEKQKLQAQINVLNVTSDESR